MSLFPSKRLSIALSPTAVAGIAYVGRWRPRPVDRQELRFADNGLSGAVSGLAEALKHWATPGVVVRLAVSNRYVRTALLPWTGARLAAKEFAVLARQRFLEHYGDMDGWEIRVDRNRAYADGALAFAMPTSLLNEVEKLCRQHRLICEGIVPGAVLSWNRYAMEQAANVLLFGLLEAEQLWLLAMQGVGHDSHLLSTRMIATSNDPVLLQQALERELFLQGMPSDTRIVLDGWGQLPAGRLGRIEIAPANSLQSAAMEMAGAGGWL